MPYSTQAWRSPVSGGKGRGRETGDKNGGKFRGKAQGRVHMSVAGQLCALCPRRRPSVWDDQLLSERARLLGPASHVILGGSYAQRLWPAGGVCQHLCRGEGPKGAMGNLSQEKSPVLGLGHQSLRPTPSTFLPGFQAQQGTTLTSAV